ncbi:MAG TPA: hypothetical protein VGB45_15600 [Abditibacterium sp.]|jgi:hypothetical protein
MIRLSAKQIAAKKSEVRLRSFLWRFVSPALLVALSGCSIAPPAPIFTSPTPVPSIQKRAQEAARYRSVGDAFAKIDAKTVRAWVDRWSAPGGLAAQNRPRAVRIDAETLARRHPAWLLANSLENGTISPASPQIARVLAMSGPSTSLTLPLKPSEATQTLPPKVVGENFEGNTAKNRQNAALNRFFADAAARDALRGRDEAFLSRRALEDSIAAAQRGAVDAIDLSLVPPDVALELTNLRLQLVRNLAKTPAERAAARAELERIEERYAQIWREQTALQAARLREVSRDLPTRQRREGLERITRESAIQTEKRNEARREATQIASARLSQDFGDRNADLRLVLPPARAVRSVSGIGSNLDNLQFEGFIETNPTVLPSMAAREKEALGSAVSFQSQQTAKLRAKARSEAKQWATLVAMQLGSQWDNAPSNPDRTAAALAILFPNR